MFNGSSIFVIIITNVQSVLGGGGGQTLKVMYNCIIQSCVSTSLFKHLGCYKITLFLFPDVIFHLTPNILTLWEYFLLRLYIFRVASGGNGNGNEKEYFLYATPPLLSQDSTDPPPPESDGGGGYNIEHINRGKPARPGLPWDPVTPSWFLFGIPLVLQIWWHPPD